MWNLHCHGHGQHISETIACLCLRFAKLQRLQKRGGSPHDRTFPQACKATLAATRPRQCFKSFRISKSTLAATCPGTATLAARPQTLHDTSASLSRATLAIGPCHLFLRAFKTARCPASNRYRPQPSVCQGGPQTPQTSRMPFQGNSCSFPQAFPRHLLQLHATNNAANPSASLSTATPATTGPRSLFVERSRQPLARPQNPSNPPTTLSKATLAVTHAHCQANSCSYTHQTMLQTLPQAVPQQHSQLQAPGIFFLERSRQPLARRQTPRTLPEPCWRPFQASRATLAATSPRQLSIYLFIYLFIYLSIDLSVHPSIHPSIYLFRSTGRGGVGGTRALAN